MEGVRDLAFDDFSSQLDLGVRTFVNLAIEGYESTLVGKDLERIVFEDCFVNFNFRECNLNGSTFERCNLKTVSFENCRMKNCTIADCSIESVRVSSSAVEGVIWGTNFSYGRTLEPEQCKLLYLESDGLAI